ncbi:MAG: hypothetical protein AAF431_12445 [Pseudomonadota bacterium]
MKLYLALIPALFIFGCAKGQVDVLNQDGEILGSCTAEFNWHWYGAKDSVDYLLYICAKEHRDNGKVISDNSIFDNDYSLPKPSEGESWNKLNAYSAFKTGQFSEQKYGYILAAIEHDFDLKKQRAREQLDSGAIDQQLYEKKIKNAESTFYGK